MGTAKGALVKDRDGARGTIEAVRNKGRDERVLIRTDESQGVIVPGGSLTPQTDGSYRLPRNFAEYEATSLRAPDSRTAEAPAARDSIIPVIEERLHVDTRTRETGRVRVTKIVHERQELVDLPLLREDVEIERVKIDQVVDEPVPVRQEGDVTIIPLLEEVMVLEKRLVLKEEVRIRRKQTERHQPQQVHLRSEDATIERENASAEPPDDDAP